MKIEEIYQNINRYANVNYSKKYCKKFDCYDNSGIILSTDADINSVIFSLDLTAASIDLAKKNNAKLIITHHPAIYSPKDTRTNDEIIEELPNDSLLKTCKSLGIGVISFHLNLDVAKKGIDYYLAKGLGAKETTLYEHLYKNIGYGRKFEVNKTFKEIVEIYKEVFNSNRITTYGDLNKKISKVASFCGSGYGASEFEYVSDVDLIVSSDVPHHVILPTVEVGKCIMIVTHYSAEVYGFRFFYKWFKKSLKFNAIFNSEEKYL